MTTMLKTCDLEFLKKSFQAGFPDFGEPMMGNISPFKLLFFECITIWVYIQYESQKSNE